MEVDETALSRLRGRQTLGAGKSTAPKLKIDKNVLAQAIGVGASTVAKGLGKRKRKDDQSSQGPAQIASEVPIESIGKTLKSSLNLPTGEASTAKT